MTEIIFLFITQKFYKDLYSEKKELSNKIIKKNKNQTSKP